MPNDNSIVFKTNSYGCYFLGTNSFMNKFTANYSYYYDKALEMYINAADADIYKTESANSEEQQTKTIPKNRLVPILLCGCLFIIFMMFIIIILSKVFAVTIKR